MRRRCLLFLKPGRAPVWLLATGLVACGWFSGAPESRARDFVEAVITEPDNAERLAALMHPRVATVDEMLDTLSGRVAVDYLRAKHRQGVPLKFNIGNVEKSVEGRKVQIAVIDPAEARHGVDNQVVFQIYLESSERGWSVTRIQTAE